MAGLTEGIPKRLIARLDIKGPNLVKGIHLEGLRVIGDPAEHAVRYYRDGIDELIYIDIVASLYGRNNLVEVVERTASEIFVPFTVWGGIRSLEDVHRLLRAGADKVAINTGAVRDPSVITKSSHTYGSQCIVLSIEAKRRLDGPGWEAYTDNGRELKYKYGMHPLTVTWAPHIYTDWGWRNHQAWIHAGFDNYLCTPNGRTHRLLTRLAVDRLFHPFQPFILGQKNLAPKMALLFNIPLVFYGENEAEYGNPQADMQSAKRDFRYFVSSDRSSIYLGGTSLDELEKRYGVAPVDLVPYVPADTHQIEQKGIEVHYLGYYLTWHPQGAYYYAVENGRFQAAPERTPGTYSKYNSIDDRIDDFHYYTTYVKFGIGRATYDASQEIRSGEITRGEGVALVKRFDGEWPARFADEIFRYLTIDEASFPVASAQFEEPTMSRESFMRLADTFRSPHLWTRVDREWRLRHAVWMGDETALRP